MSKTARFVSVIFLSTSLVTIGCNKAPQDGVVATVNGHAIQRTEVDKALQRAARATIPSSSRPRPTRPTQLRLNILHQLILEEIVEQRAAKLNLTATDEEVDAKLAEMKAPYTEEQFQPAPQSQQPHPRRREARPAPLAHHRQAAQQGDQLQDHRHRRRRSQLLQRAQVGVQPDREPVPPRADPGDRHSRRSRPAIFRAPRPAHPKRRCRRSRRSRTASTPAKTSAPSP